MLCDLTPRLPQEMLLPRVCSLWEDSLAPQPAVSEFLKPESTTKMDPHLTLAGSLCGRHTLSLEDPTPYSWLRLCPSLQPTRGGSALPDSPSPLLADHSALLHPLKATEGLSKVQTDLILLCFN